MEGGQEDDLGGLRGDQMHLADALMLTLVLVSTLSCHFHEPLKHGQGSLCKREGPGLGRMQSVKSTLQMVLGVLGFVVTRNWVSLTPQVL